MKVKAPMWAHKEYVEAATLLYTPVLQLYGPHSEGGTIPIIFIYIFKIKIKTINPKQTTQY